MRKLLSEHFVQLIRDIIVPVRVIIAGLIVFLTFLFAEEILYRVFVWLSTDIKSRVPFVGWVLDGVQVLSIVSVSVYFIYSTIAGLQMQWRIASNIEKKANRDEGK